VSSCAQLGRKDKHREPTYVRNVVAPRALVVGVTMTCKREEIECVS
jgi:hypothetical protein